MKLKTLHKNYTVIIHAEDIFYIGGNRNSEKMLLRHIYTKYNVYKILRYFRMPTIDAWQVTMDIVEEEFDGNDILKKMVGQ